MATISCPPRPRPELAPLVRGLLAAAAAVLTALCLYGFVRWLAGASPATPWVRSPALAIHLASVIPAIPLGAFVLLSRKGDRRHRLAGKLWLVLMLVAASSSLFLRGLNDGQFSFVHLFSLMTFLAVPKAIRTARAGDIAAHRAHMVAFYAGALLIAGATAFSPGRTMWQWAFSAAT